MKRRKLGSLRYPCESSHRVHLVPPQQRLRNRPQAVQRGVSPAGSVSFLIDASGALVVPTGRNCPAPSSLRCNVRTQANCYFLARYEEERRLTQDGQERVKTYLCRTDT